MKKYFTLILLALLSIVANAYDAYIDGIYYNFSENEATVTYESLRYNVSAYTGFVSIPQSVTYNNKTYRVTSIGYDAFYTCSGLTSVTIPESVTSIDNGAFRDCKSLTSITIGNGVTSIGEIAFYGCSSLASITIPNSVTHIGREAFRDCSGLTSVTIGNGVTSISYGAFLDCHSLTKVIVTDIAAWCRISFGGYSANPLFYANHLYSNETIEITDLVIPNSVTSINDYAFYYGGGLKSVTIGNEVTNIGSYAFSNCSGLTSVIIGNGVTNINGLAFSNCSCLTSIIIGNSIANIGTRAFYGCSVLADVFCYAENIPSTVYCYGYYVFEKSLVASATLHVPRGSVNSYKAFTPWNFFGAIVALKEIKGDQNSDFKVDIADAVSVLNIMAENKYNEAADVNGDSKVDIADFVTILNIMAQQ